MIKYTSKLKLGRLEIGRRKVVSPQDDTYLNSMPPYLTIEFRYLDNIWLEKKRWTNTDIGLSFTTGLATLYFLKSHSS
jgi:hypothetical protein